MTSIALSIITLVITVWCALTAYIAYRVTTLKSQIAQEDYIFAISCLVIACVFIAIFAIYAYNREGDDAGFAEQSLVSGFRWYDAAILVILVVWCALSIAISSILLREYDLEHTDDPQKKQQTAAKKAPTLKLLSSTDKNLAISTIVFAVVVLVQYITFLIVQERLPNWCRRYARSQEEQRKILEEMIGFSRSSTQSQQPQILVVPQVLAQAQAQAQPKSYDDYSIRI